MRTAAALGRAMSAFAESTQFRRFFRLARLVLVLGQQGIFLGSGRMKMAKFEALAFAAGFVMTGFLSLVALPLA